jgi:hypothetical protein
MAEAVAKETLYLTLDGRVVKEGDPAANEVLCVQGSPVSDKLAQRHGIEREAPAMPPEKKEEHAAGGGSKVPGEGLTAGKAKPEASEPEPEAQPPEDEKGAAPAVRRSVK